MASRPAFIPRDTSPWFEEVRGEFTFNPGFAPSQKRKNVEALHEALRLQHGMEDALEVSTKSQARLGEELSAFRLTFAPEGETARPVELWYQASKQFEDGGPFPDLLESTPRDAKRDPRLRESGDFLGFVWRDEFLPIEAEGAAFYDALYLWALSQNPALAQEAGRFQAFTDIEFNDKRMFACQARTVAIYVGLAKARDALPDTVQEIASLLGTRPNPHGQSGRGL